MSKLDYFDNRFVKRVGQMDDVATNDNMTDIEATSVMAKLRLILNRLSTDAFKATIQGSTHTELDAMLAQLATYFVATGGEMALQVNNKTARTNIQQALDDYFTVIGCNSTNEFNPTISGTPRETLSAALVAMSAISDTIATKVGSPQLGSTDSDVASVLGDPGAGKNISTLIGDVQTEVDKIGDPQLGSTGSDIASVLGDPGSGKDITVLIGDVQTEVDKIGSPQLGSTDSNIALVLGDPGIGKDISVLIGDVQTEVDKIGVPDVDLVTDIAAIQTEVDKIGSPQIGSTDATLAEVLGAPSSGKNISALIGDVQFVIGESTDAPSVATLRERIESVYEHVHSVAKVYPTVGDGTSTEAAEGIQVTASTGAWQLGTAQTIIPAGTVTDAFDIHWLNCEQMSANGTYEIVLYVGSTGADTEIGRVRATRTTNQDKDEHIFMESPVISGGGRVWARVACSAASANINLSLGYHTYSG